MPPADKWDLVEKVFMRELTRSSAARTQEGDQANADMAYKARAVLEAGHDCGMVSKVADAQGNVVWSTLACFAHAVSTMPRASQTDMLDQLQSDSCFGLALKYSGLASVDCPAPVKSDPAYVSDATVRAASWDPSNPGAGPKYVPSSTPPQPQVPPTPVLPPTPADGSPSALVQKILMRELTRVAGANAAQDRRREDAMYAINIRAHVVLGKCEVTNGFLLLVSQKRYAALACQMYLLASAPAAVRAQFLQLLQGNRCYEAAMVTGSLAGLTPCPASVSDDPAYASEAAAKAASWNPYDANAGQEYPIGSAPPPVVAVPPTGDLTMDVCVAAMDASMSAQEKQVTCQVVADPNTPVPALVLIQQSLTWRGFSQAAAFVGAAVAARQAGIPGAPPSGLPVPQMGCSPFPACLIPGWPASVPTPNLPNVGCSPFPGCLTDANNWSSSQTPQQLGDQPYCTPWPSCLCQVPFVQPMCAGLPPLPVPTIAQPGTATPTAEQVSKPWYETTAGMIGIGVASLLVLGGGVALVAHSG